MPTSDTWISFNGNALSLNGFGLVVRGQNPYNPLNLPAYTVRFQFDDTTYDPLQESGWKDGSAWTRVSTSPNIWDYYTGTAVQPTSSAYQGTFYNKFNSITNTVHVLGAYLPPLPSQRAADGRTFFAECSAILSTGIMDLSGFNTLQGTFSYCARLNTVDDIYAINVSGFAETFRGCTSLTLAPNIASGNSVTSTVGMFRDCQSLAAVNLFDTSNVTSVQDMFNGCSSLASIPLFNTSKSTNFHNMFSHCSSLYMVPLLDTSSATDTSTMFYQCTNLNVSPIFNTTRVTNFYDMYGGCQELTNVPLLDTTNAIDVRVMFAYCYKVQSGALALYNQMSSQAYPPPSYGNCFGDCGRDTDPSAPIHAELAQIPTSWGGTMA